MRAMKPSRFLLCAFAALACAACSVTRTGTFAPAVTQLDIRMSDLEYLGQTEISVEYRTYVGFITVIDRINGEQFTGEERRRVCFDSRCGGGLCLDGRLRQAAYKALDEFPQADYFLPVNRTRTKTRLFLGGEVSEKAVVKAYSFK